MSLIRVIEVEPAGSRNDVDSIIIPDDGTSWQTVMREVEGSLDKQWCQIDSGEKEWNDIKVTITCRTMTDIELEELEDF